MHRIIVVIFQNSNLHLILIFTEPIWGPWSPYEDCCANGQQNRIRVCQKADLAHGECNALKGQNIDSKPCPSDLKECPPSGKFLT